MLNRKPYGNNDATTTKTVSVDFTYACYIHGSNRVQGLAFTNFENSYSDTSVRRISSDSIRNFLRLMHRLRFRESGKAALRIYYSCVLLAIFEFYTD